MNLINYVFYVFYVFSSNSRSDYSNYMYFCYQHAAGGHSGILHCILSLLSSAILCIIWITACEKIVCIYFQVTHRFSRSWLPHNPTYTNIYIYICIYIYKCIKNIYTYTFVNETVKDCHPWIMSVSWFIMLKMRQLGENSRLRPCTILGR